MRIGMNLELDPGWQSGTGGEPRNSYCVIGITRPARVRQQEKLFRIDEIENVRKWIVLAGQIGPAQRHGYDLGATGNKGIAHRLVRRKFSGADEQPRSEFTIGDFQLGRLIRHHGNIFVIMPAANTSLAPQSVALPTLLRDRNW